jgi:hypothetical protein
VRRTFHGGCHCGALRFEAEIDLAAVGTGKCNCSYCAKARLWLVRAEPDAFRLEAQSGALSEYRGKNPVARHYFCARCGVNTHDVVGTPNATGRPYVNVSVSCLEDASVDEVVGAPLRFYDGRNDAWERTPAETRHL